MQERFTRKSFIGKMVAGLSLASLSGLAFGSRSEASVRAPGAAVPTVKTDPRSVSRTVTGVEE